MFIRNEAKVASWVGWVERNWLLQQDAVE